MNLAHTLTLFAEAVTDYVTRPRGALQDRRARNVIRFAVKDYAAGAVEKSRALQTIESTLRKIARSNAEGVLENFGQALSAETTVALQEAIAERMVLIDAALDNAQEGDADFHARLTAKTELLGAKQMGAQLAYAAAGREVLKTWTTTSAETCETCQENEDVGPIPVDEPFPSGDFYPPAHPACACAVVYEYDDAEGVEEE
jgi:hypothetical protein